VIGVVLEVREIGTINVKGADKKKREVVLGDESGHGIVVTLWEDEAIKDIRVGEILSMENAMMGEFRSVKTLSGTKNSEIVRNG
jgi:ssDNA-binding replication factor A large subunit